jgi:hypothetical protein
MKDEDIVQPTQSFSNAGPHVPSCKHYEVPLTEGASTCYFTLSCRILQAVTIQLRGNENRLCKCVCVRACVRARVCMCVWKTSRGAPCEAFRMAWDASSRELLRCSKYRSHFASIRISITALSLSLSIDCISWTMGKGGEAMQKNGFSGRIFTLRVTDASMKSTWLLTRLSARQ